MALGIPSWHPKRAEVNYFFLLYLQIKSLPLTQFAVIDSRKKVEEWWMDRQYKQNCFHPQTHVDEFYCILSEFFNIIYWLLRLSFNNIWNDSLPFSNKSIIRNRSINKAHICVYTLPNWIPKKSRGRIYCWRFEFNFFYVDKA